MTTVGLVSSTNGLGHARRLLEIAIGLGSLDIKCILFISQKQSTHLNLELSKYVGIIQVVQILNHGIDGPEWLNEGSPIITPSRTTLRQINRCDLIIVDNVVWPLEYHSNCIFIGHFTWLKYWARTNNIFLPTRILHRLEIESQLFSKLRKILYFKDFSNNLIGTLPEQAEPIKLLRYDSDVCFQGKPRNTNVIWVAQGTTGLGADIKINKKIVNQYLIEYKETFKMQSSDFLPYLVIGRPGLGTIRDCLSSGTRFLGINYNGDPELEANIRSLMTLDLYSKDDLVNAMNYKPEISNKKIQYNWENAWGDLSVNIKSICMQILNFTDIV